VESLVGSLKGQKVALLGLTFKAGTDDARESVGIRLANALASMGAEVMTYDPRYRHDGKNHGSFVIAGSVEDCLKGADCCIVTNEWDEFKALTPQTFTRLMKRPIVFDGRGLYNVKSFTNAKVSLRRIGVGPRSR
jgi:UDPglucose 6-dehydrogenase